jgi:adenosylcobinamide-GDP ribazoletransferase
VLDLGRAFTVLTILPIGRYIPWTGEELPRCAAYFPVVGAALGSLLWGLDTLLAPIFGPLVRAAILLATLAIATGGLHLDGLADTCDGLFSRAPRERALEIMHQGSIGALGAASLVLTLLLKFSLLAALDGPLRGSVLFLMPLIGRQVVVLVIAAFGPAQSGTGLGNTFARRVGRQAIPCSLLLSGVLVGAAWAFLRDARYLASTGSIVALGGGCAAALLCSLVAAAVAARRLGGTSGDVYGALIEVAELTFAFVACMGL